MSNVPAVEAVARYVGARTWVRAKLELEFRLVALCNDAVPAAFDALRAEVQDDEESVRFLDERREVLERACRDGIPAAVAPKLGLPPLEKIDPSDIRRLFASTTSEAVQALLEDRPVLRGALEHLNLAQAALARIEETTEADARLEALDTALAVVHRGWQPDVWETLVRDLVETLPSAKRDRPAHVDDAIEYTAELFGLGAAAVPANQGAELLLRLSDLYSERINGDREDNLDAALTFARSAQEVAQPETSPKLRAAAEHRLGSLYGQRFRDDRENNIRLAVAHLEQALELWARGDDPDEWALTQHNLGLAYRELSGSEARERALESLRAAASIFTRSRDAYHWALCQLDLGTTLYRLRADGAADDVENAILHIERSLEVFTREVFEQEWAMASQNLAAAYGDRVAGDRAENIEHALSLYGEALTVFTRDRYPAEWATINYNRALMYRRRVTGDRAANIEHALACFDRALEVRTPEAQPAAFVQTKAEVGHLQFAEARWDDAYQAYAEAMETAEVVTRSAHTLAGRERAIRKIPLISTRAAHCLRERGEPAKAFEQLERGKTLLVADRLAVASLEPAGLDRSARDDLEAARLRVRELEFELDTTSGTEYADDRLREARAHLADLTSSPSGAHGNDESAAERLAEHLALVPADGALVAPLVTSQGGCAFVVPGNAPTLNDDHVVRLDRFDQQALVSLLVGESGRPGWVTAYPELVAARRDGPTSGWSQVFARTAIELWELFVGPVHERLDGLGVARGAPLLILPHGGVGVLPIHAAAADADGPSLLDDYAVSYAPSLRAFAMSRTRLGARPHGAPFVIAVADPDDDLPYARLEGKIVAAAFPEACLLTGEQATLAKLAEVARRATHVHLGCHGWFDPAAPWGSGLDLAGGERATSRDVAAELHLEQAPLVVLSACESGITDVVELPDEGIGLPMAFLEAGAGSVVHTLWPVDDLATCLLMRRFYSSHIIRGWGPALALRDAQLWLRAATREALADGFKTLSQGIGGTEARSAYEDLYLGGAPDDTPYAHPYYWAAFSTTAG